MRNDRRKPTPRSPRFAIPARALSSVTRCRQLFQALECAQLWFVRGRVFQVYLSPFCKSFPLGLTQSTYNLESFLISPLISYCFHYMPEWWNGRRAGLKIKSDRFNHNPLRLFVLFSGNSSGVTARETYPAH